MEMNKGNNKQRNLHKNYFINLQSAVSGRCYVLMSVAREEVLGENLNILTFPSEDNMSDLSSSNGRPAGTSAKNSLNVELTMN